MKFIRLGIGFMHSPKPLPPGLTYLPIEFNVASYQSNKPTQALTALKPLASPKASVSQTCLASGNIGNRETNLADHIISKKSSEDKEKDVFRHNLPFLKQISLKYSRAKLKIPAETGLWETLPLKDESPRLWIAFCRGKGSH